MQERGQTIFSVTNLELEEKNLVVMLKILDLFNHRPCLFISKTEQSLCLEHYPVPGTEAGTFLVREVLGVVLSIWQRENFT